MVDRTVFGAGLSVRLECSAGTLDVFSIAMDTSIFGSGGRPPIPTMRCEVNLGTVVNKAGAKTQITPQQFQQLVAWGPAKVVVKVEAVSGLVAYKGLLMGDNIIFTGAVVNVTFGQESAFQGGGNISCTVTLDHQIAAFFQGDLSTWPVYGAACMNGTYLDDIHKKTPDTIAANATLLGKDYKAFCRQIFESRAKAEGATPVSNEISAFQFTNQNSGVMGVFDSIDFQMDLDNLSPDSFVHFYWEIVNIIVNSISYDTSFADMLGILLDLVDGWIVPNSTGFVVRPRAAAPKVTRVLTSSDYTRISFGGDAGDPMNKFVGGGIAFAAANAGGTSFTGPDEPGAVGVYNLPPPLARSSLLFRYEMPTYLNHLIGRNTSQKDGSNKELDSYNPQQLEVVLASDKFNQILNSEFAQKWIAYKTLQRTLSAMGIVVITPLRFDIGIGNAVEVQAPSLDGVTSLGSMCGTVTSVKMMIDGQSKMPVCQYIIAGVAEKKLYDSIFQDAKNPFSTSNTDTGSWVKPTAN